MTTHIDVEVLVQDLREANETRKQTLTELFAAQKKHADAKHDLEAETAAALIDGRVNGSNESTRKGQLAAAVELEKSALQDAEAEMYTVQFNNSIAQMDWELQLTMLRCSELAEKLGYPA